MLYERWITENILRALADTPVVTLHGPRQSGKTTLMRALAKDHYPARYVTLDDLQTLALAKDDPVRFIEGLDGPIVIDEVQKAPDLFSAIKASVDRNRRPGRFLLTGSASVLAIPRMAEALAGRVEIHHLWPLSCGERIGVKEGFIDALFSDDRLAFIDEPESESENMRATGLNEMILKGGYPEALSRETDERRDDWFRSYIDTILQRDVRELSNIAGLVEMPKLLAILAARAGGLVNYSDLAREAGLSHTTLARYVALLRAIFVLRPVRPWFTNRIKRLMKSEKLFFCDTGLLSHLLNLTPGALSRDTRARGALAENFVAAELFKQVTWSRTRPDIYHLRSATGTEVDFLLESRGGRRQVGIEVKTAATVGPNDFKGLRLLAEAMPETFHRGVVLHAGRETIPFGPNLYAMPVSALWRLGAAHSFTAR